MSDEAAGRQHYCLDAEGERLHLYSQVVRATDARELPPGVPRTQLARGVIVQVIDRDRMRVQWPGEKYSEPMRSSQVLKVEPLNSIRPGEPC